MTKDELIHLIETAFDGIEQPQDIPIQHLEDVPSRTQLCHACRTAFLSARLYDCQFK